LVAIGFLRLPALQKLSAGIRFLSLRSGEGIRWLFSLSISRVEESFDPLT
jgi:hypothetical protein